MAAGIVDDLELVQIEDAERIRGLARLGALQGPLHAVFELAAIDQPREDIVAGVIAQAPVQFAGFAHVVEHEHTARDRAAPVTYR